MSIIELGESVPPLTPHATSVSLPKWSDNVGYEEGLEHVVGKMTIGYPRFFINKLIVAFAEDIAKAFGKPGEQAILLPSSRAARRCIDFMFSSQSSILPNQLHVIELVWDRSQGDSEVLAKVSPSISAVLFPKDLFPIAKQYWQHSGDGVSSRRAEFCHRLFREGILVDRKALQTTPNDSGKSGKGPRRYQRGSTDKTSPKTPTALQECTESLKLASTNGTADTNESSQFVEERFGRNLGVSFVQNAKSAVRRRIAGSLTEEVDLTKELSTELGPNIRGVAELSEDDVYLFPCGMNAIFMTHQMLLKARKPMKSIVFGFPYVDTLKILQKWGPGYLFYGNGSPEDLDDLETKLEAGERFTALFCEFPSNPLLKCPDLKRIRQLADKYDIVVVVDESIGNFINVHVLPYADVVVSSLTKIFSGECNVMGGGAIFNPRGKYYEALKAVAKEEYEDNYWAEDAIFLERNSRDFITRIEQINNNAEVICDILRASPLVATVYYPKYSDTRKFYDDCRTVTGGYGGLLSLLFHTKAQAIAFFDRIETAKGPSLGTNFTLTSPYVILAHYLELDWAAQFGVPADLIRISVGLEDANDLRERFAVALKAAEEATS